MTTCRLRSLIVLAAALLLQPACAGPAQPATSPATSAVLAGSSGFSPGRRVAIGMESGPPALLWVNPQGRLVGNAELTDRSLFVLVPSGDAHRIRTAVPDPSGTYACMGVRAGEPATVWAAVCNPRAAGQLFTFAGTDQRDSAARRKYRITTNAGALTFNSRDGVHIEPRDGIAITGFALIDQGPGRS